MDWLEFIEAMTGHLLSWPVVGLTVALLFLGPLKALIGRMKNAKAFGGEFVFGDLMEKTEERIDDVLDSTLAASIAEPQLDAAGKSGEQSRPAPGTEKKLSPDASEDPSGAILASWAQLLGTLSTLSRIKAGPGRPSNNAKSILNQLRNNGSVSIAFIESAENLLELRNQVAHGEANPSQGAAQTYVERAHQLEMSAKGLIALSKMDLNKPIYIDGNTITATQ
jgi:hypothetical protein